MTSYMVLSLDTEGKWTELTPVVTHSAREAVQKAYMKQPHDCVAIVAVPARSWKPTPIRTETTTRVVLGDEPQPEPVQEKDPV